MSAAACATPVAPSDIGGLHCRRVVDAVAEKADDLSIGLKRLDDAGLLVGREAAKGVDRLNPNRQSVVAQR
jgi:hypothetical protein